MKVALALLTLVLAGCAVSAERRPWIEAGMAYDFKDTVGSNPACIVRVRAPVHFGPIPPGGLIVSYTHHSSCPDLDDANTVDQVELVAKFYLGRER
jgi:hypothetical protein